MHQRPLSIPRHFRLLLPLLLLLATGCSQYRVHLEYLQPQHTGAKLNRPTIYLEKFEDKRIDRSRVGVGRNGYNMEITDVLTEQDVATWLSNALAMEMEKAGFVVVKVDGQQAAGNQPLPLLQGYTNRVFTDMLMAFPRMELISNIKLHLKLTLPDQVLERDFFAVEIDRSAVGFGANSYKEIMEKTARQITAEIVESLVSLHVWRES